MDGLSIERGNGYIAPRIQEDHVDGPVLTFSDGQMHWLTWGERLTLWLGGTNAWLLQAKYRPDLNHITPFTAAFHAGRR